jgi:hypothetical protein
MDDCIVLTGFTNKCISRTEKLHLATVDLLNDFVQLEL